MTHLVEPVGRRGEPAPVEDHPDGEVGVVEVEVEGDAPHDDEPRVQVLDLPADRAAGASGGAGLTIRGDRERDPKMKWVQSAEKSGSC